MLQSDVHQLPSVANTYIWPFDLSNRCFPMQDLLRERSAEEVERDETELERLEEAYAGGLRRAILTQVTLSIFSKRVIVKMIFLSH